jgi:hypothetical protein
MLHKSFNMFRTTILRKPHFDVEREKKDSWTFKEWMQHLLFIPEVPSHVISQISQDVRRIERILTLNDIHATLRKLGLYRHYECAPQILRTICANRSIQEDCPICLDSMKEKQAYRTLCMHAFHVTCLNMWETERRTAGLSLYCPMCRSSKGL